MCGGPARLERATNCQEATALPTELRTHSFQSGEKVAFSHFCFKLFSTIMRTWEQKTESCSTPTPFRLVEPRMCSILKFYDREHFDLSLACSIHPDLDSWCQKLKDSGESVSVKAKTQTIRQYTELIKILKSDTSHSSTSISGIQRAKIDFSPQENENTICHYRARSLPFRQ